MIIRKYKPEDCKHLAKLFYNTVHDINVRDYTRDQLNVWAVKNVDLNKWNQSFLEHFTVVAMIDNIIVGFGDIDKSGYLNRLYVHKDFQRMGIATAMCDKLEAIIEPKKVHTHASITAKPFFENRGYKIIKEQQVERNGIWLTNYVMQWN